MTRSLAARDFLFLVLLTAGVILLHGYHIGVQDQAIYLPAIQKNLDPSLYPSDSVFFESQARWMIFDEAVAALVRWTPLSLEWTLFLLQLLTVGAVLLGCLRLARMCFQTPAGQWGAVGLVAAMLPLPVTGAMLLIVDNYLHPRALVTAAILLAMPSALRAGWGWLVWMVAAAPIHPMMAAMGGYHLAVQRWRPPRRMALLAALPLLPFLFQAIPGDQAWRVILESRRHLYPLRWTWYEWIGIVVPLGFLAWMGWSARTRGATVGHLSRRLLLSTSACIVGALVVTNVPGLERLIILQPMRALHLAYIGFFLLLGGIIGQKMLRESLLRWILFFGPVCAIMFYVQVRTFAGSAHWDWPGAAPRNQWVQAFAWAREHTLPDARFALDPNYMRLPGEDYYGFRAFAERSVLADNVKDRSVSSLSPRLATRWREESRDAAEVWEKLTPEGLQSLAAKYQVGWVVLRQPGIPGLDCPYSNLAVLVCRVPESPGTVPSSNP